MLNWVIENGGQILLDELGYTDAKKCFGQRDVESCLWTLVNVVMVGVAVSKIPAVAKIIYKVGKGVNVFLDGMDRARFTLERLRKLVDTLKRASRPSNVSSAGRWAAPRRALPPSTRS